MSDITKKILSIEPDFEPKTKPARDSIIKSVDIGSKPAAKSAGTHASDIPSLRGSSTPETYPDFITREGKAAGDKASEDKIAPIAAKPKPAQTNESTQYTAEVPKTAWIMWTGIALTLIWMAASAAIYYGLFGTTIKALSPVALSGLILAVLLPAVLITLLWMTWRRLALISYEAGRVTHAAQILTRADESALINTRNLAVGIQSELSLVDEQLGKMLGRFEGLKNDVTSHGQDINAVGLTLTERTEDVGRNLTLQRQALESITSTFDTRMETLGTTIETQSTKLSELTDTAAKNIETAEQTLTQAAETLTKSSETLNQTSQDTSQALETSHQAIESGNKNLSDNHEQLSALHDKIAELVSALKTQQDKVKADLVAQSENLQSMSDMAKGSTDSLQQNLSLGSDLLTALSKSNSHTKEAMQQRFTDMEAMIEETQSRADALTESANSRLQDSLTQTREELSKLETDVQALNTKLDKKSSTPQQLNLDGIEPQKSGHGRLNLKPLETDFPPVEPPRFTSQDKTPSYEQPPLDLPLDLEGAELDTPINLGADMEIENPDADIINLDPDVLRPAADMELTGKGFGKTRNTKEKAKSGWRWRDMLGGLEQPDAKPASNAPLTMPDMNIDELSAHMISRLTSAKLTPSAIVDKGTVIEAAKARVKSGPATMLTIVDTRLSAPVSHLRGQLAAHPAFKNTTRNFVTQYGQIIAQSSVHDKDLRTKLSTNEGRAYLLCAAALS